MCSPCLISTSGLLRKGINAQEWGDAIVKKGEDIVQTGRYPHFCELQLAPVSRQSPVQIHASQRAACGRGFCTLSIKASTEADIMEP